MKRHGKSKTFVYYIWKTMRQRCLNPKNHKYKNYGGRGVKICDAWNDFEIFEKDMGERASLNHSLDRIDVNGNYTPENCRWASSDIQQHNKTNTKLVETPLGNLHFKELSKQTGIPYACLRTRFYRDGKRGKDLIV